MNSKAEASQSTLDTLKLGVAALLVIGALVAFYFYPEASKLTRFLGLIGAIAVAVAVALQTDKGRAILSFMKEAQLEVRKVVWPTRQETMQTTMVVMFVVVIVAIFLWLLDLMLGAIVRFLMGQGG